MNSLDRKLFRDLWHARGQVIAIALVVACGIASFVMARSAYTSLTLNLVVKNLMGNLIFSIVCTQTAITG